MLTKELRLRNWISIENTFHKVVEIRQDSVVSVWQGGGNPEMTSDFDGIEITHDLLVDLCGFSISKHCSGSNAYWIGSFGLIQLGNGRWYIVGLDSVHKGIRCLHELQNLFYSIMGVELSVNL